LSKYKARAGQRVKRGDVIGYVEVRRSEAPHLHYEVLKDKKVVNPLNFFITEYFSRICGYCTISQSREPIVDYYKMDQVQE
jgi:murein DD-endopeptidase MepM/ murein hydrolase activator NlpD